MKKLVCKSSIVFPLLLISFILLFGTTLVIQAVNIYLSYSQLNVITISLTVVWLCCSPMRKDCCNGHWPEVLFNLFPVELICFLFFAQYQFALSLSILIACLISLIGLAIYLNFKTQWSKSSFYRYKQRKVNKIIFRRASLLTCALFSVVPCILVLALYGFESPKYKGKLYNEPVVATEIQDKTTIYEQYTTTLLQFDENTWKKLDINKKVELLQDLANFEAKKLVIPNVPIKIEKLEAFTLGEYNLDTKEIRVDIGYVNTASAEVCVETICHEICHAWQQFLIENIDWNSEIAKNPYFDQVRDWRENQEAYVQPGSDYEEYEVQPLEVAARAYAAEETASLMQFINLNKVEN